jgi:hypothetical protein
MSEKKDAGYIQNLWRPMMGWMYMVICMLDMAVFPVLWSLLQAMMHQPITQWNPLTLQGAGLFHIAMGAVLGISAFGRTQEKLAGTAANPTTTQTINTQNMTGNVAGGFGSGQQNTGGFGGGAAFGAAPTGGFGGNTGGFGASQPSTGFGTGGFGSTPSPAPVPAPGGFGSSSGFGTPATPAVTASGKKIVPTDPDPEL